MEQLNRIELRGTVGSTRLSNISGRYVLNFTLATNYAYTDRAGNPVIETTWHNIVAWDKEDFPDLTTIAKGTRVFVCGRLRTQKYMGSDDVERSYNEVLASRLALVENADTFTCEMI